MKQQAQHTPGPWTVRDNRNNTLGIDAHEPDGSYCQPARVNGNASDSVYGPVTWANARLIAAAPDLLAALKAAAAYYEMLERATGVTHGVLAEIRAAIAKAEGGE